MSELKLQVCQKIRSLRQNSGRTVEDICESLNVSPSTYYNWEQHTLPSMDRLAEIAKEFGVSLRSLFPK